MLFEGGLRGTAFIHSPILRGGVQKGGVQKRGVQKGGVQEGGVQKGGVQKGSVQKEGVQKRGVQKAGVQEAGVLREGYSYRGLMGVVDWAPTLLSIATNGDPDRMIELMPGVDGVDQWGAIVDGVDQWGAILGNTTYPRTELLHNIDPLGRGSPVTDDHHHPDINTATMTKNPRVMDLTPPTRYARAAIRVGHFKLLVGDVGVLGSDRPDLIGWKAPPGYTPAPPPPLPAYCRNRSTASPTFLFNISADPHERWGLRDEAILRLSVCASVFFYLFIFFIVH